jgi:hypothetical protein
MFKILYENSTSRNGGAICVSVLFMGEVCNGIIIPVVDGNNESKQCSTNPNLRSTYRPTRTCVYRKRERRNQSVLPNFKPERVAPLLHILEVPV